MDHIQKFTKQFRDHIFGLLLVNNILILVDIWLVNEILHLTGYWALAFLLIIPILSLTILPWISTKYLVQPTKLIWQAILHIAPDTANTPAPDLKKNHLGQELVSSLVAHVYQLASVAENVEKMADKAKNNINEDFVATRLPLPMLILDKEGNVIFVNEAMLSYIKRSHSDVIGQNVYSVIDMSFRNEHTFDEWLKSAQGKKAIDTQFWERVRLSLENDKVVRLFDLAAYYNQNNPQNYETMIVFFDHTLQYSQDEQAMSLVAIAVHELRTPLTLLRGYIEAFEEELNPEASGQMADYMQKMSATAQQMAAFVNNMLNIARIENDQLVLHLQDGDWPEILKAAVEDMRLRAQVRNIKIELQIDQGLQNVAVDRASIYEVVSNLIDNAIKYSGNSKKIVVHSYIGKNGMIETTVQDFGNGIPEGSVQNLFEKFYRNHRSRAQIGGTGLGLYLSKKIIDAHGGNIWVRSKEGQGAIFGFALQTYKQFSAKETNHSVEKEEIVHTPHGWIKNHSLYRR